jgi:hypothetical protein
MGDVMTSSVPSSRRQKLSPQSLPPPNVKKTSAAGYSVLSPWMTCPMRDYSSRLVRLGK